MNVLFIGQGRIGLPQALSLAKAGHRVYGYDKNSQIIDLLSRGEICFFEPDMLDSLRETLDSSYFPILSIGDAPKNIDAIIFAIGTSAPDSFTCLGKKTPEVGPIKDVIDDLYSRGFFDAKPTLILRTTLYLGSTDLIKSYIEKTYTLKEGCDFNLCFSPERLMEGRAMQDEFTLPKIVGAYTSNAIECISKLFEKFDCEILTVKNPVTAEFCKLADNAYRSTIFAFSNDMAVHADGYDVDIIEVIGASNKNYTRNAIPLPGFVSGYCLGKDPYIFEYNFQSSANDRGFNSVWYNARLSNDWLVDYVFKKVSDQLSLKGIPLKQAKILILGISFKEDVDDFRMSHSLKLIELFENSNVLDIRCYDPSYGKSYYSSASQKSSLNFSDTINEEIFRDIDAIIVAHRHKELIEMDSKILNSFLKLTSQAFIYDAWNIWRNKVSLTECRYMGLGFNFVE